MVVIVEKIVELSSIEIYMIRKVNYQLLVVVMNEYYLVIEFA